MNPYWWKCKICNFGNPPELKSCSNCGSPDETVYVETKYKRADIPPLDFYSKLTNTKKIIYVVAFICSGVGVLISYAGFNKVGGFGIGLTALSGIVLIAIRNSVEK